MAKTKPLETESPPPKLDNVIGWAQSSLFNNANFPRYNPDELVGRKGLRIYDRMMVDEQVKAVVRFKRDAVTARGYMFAFEKSSSLSETEKARRIALFDRIVREMRGSFEDALNAITTGVWRGFSLTEKVFSTLEFDGQNYIGISQLVARPAESFVFYADDFGNLQKLEQQQGAKRQQLPITRFVHYVQNPEFDPFYGRSDLRECYRSWYAKDVVIKFWLLYLERFGGGFTIAKRTPESSIRPNTAEYTTLENAIQNLRNVTGLIVPPGIDLEVVTPSTTDQYERAITYHDLSIAKSLLVPNLLGLSHAGQTGSYSQSQTQLEAFFWTLANDSNRLAACLNEQLFRELADWNFGDGEYPLFRFKPASLEHVKWVISTWRDLVQARAVEVTDEDEQHLRNLLDMPSLIEQNEQLAEDERTGSVDPTKSLQGQQLSGLLDIIGKVARGELPKETAEQLIVVAFPVTQAAARELLEKVEEGSIEPPPALPAITSPPGQSSQLQNKPPQLRSVQSRHEHGDGCGLGPRIIPDRQLFTASRAAFDRAIQRVPFAVIDRKAEEIADETARTLAGQVARAVQPLVTDVALRPLLDQDVRDIEELRLESGDVSRFKTTAKSMLSDAWGFGWRSAEAETKAARGDEFKRIEFKALREEASAWIEAKGFRMAGDLSDNIRQTLQNELLTGVKFGWSPQQTRVAIYARLIGKGFTDPDAVAYVERDPALLEQVKELLGFDPAAGARAVRTYLNTMTRTTLFEAMNEARFAYFTDSSLGGFVQALEYSAILDDRTTPICRELDGKIFRKDSPEWNEYRPPNHFNCRSVLVAITVADDWSGEESDRPH